MNKATERREPLTPRRISIILQALGDTLAVLRAHLRDGRDRLETEAACKFISDAVNNVRVGMSPEAYLAFRKALTVGKRQLESARTTSSRSDLRKQAVDALMAIDEAESFLKPQIPKPVRAPEQESEAA